MIKLTGCAGPVPLDNRERFRVLTCIAGAFEISWDGGQPLSIGLGETLLVPAACPNPKLQEAAPGSSLLCSFLPELEEDVFAPLRSVGYADKDIRELGGLEGLA